ncbi:YhgE/Pip domain-containing protein [Hoyosella subflava]|uniref:Membrane protein n=1 Tax=Hoyosella subflava (strain DSM 45089 / JCM 17490 / NBRC 109087 / DQS3-9A1) TaxID=443218 RepID=F6EL13_HOYSD|nr:YhgE/Pip domain-containing protein [Hoyosella subflava]AEF42676.1 Membrane protein [Hoyosella subflava DQS3-9A1]
MHAPRPVSRWHRSRTMRIVLSLVITLPLAFAALFMWAMWNPTEKLKHLPVALVNSDQPAGEGDDTVRAGDEIVNTLLDGGALDWQVVDADQAAEGLRAADYYFTVEIPEDFSSTLSGLSNGVTEPASIRVTYNDNNTTMASTVGARVMATLNAAVLKSTSSRTVGTVLTGMNDLGGGIRDAADGAGRLADGTGQLTGGVDQVADGVTGQLAPGVSEARAGGVRLADGAEQLADGLVRLQNGTGELGDGAQRLSDGLNTLAGTVDPDGTLAGRVAALQNQLASLPDPVGSEGAAILGKVEQLLDGIAQLNAGSAELARQLNDPAAQYRSGVDTLAVGGGELATGARTLADGLGRIEAGVGQLASNLPRLQDGARQLDDGAGQLADGLGAGAQRVPDLGDDASRTQLASLVSTPVALDANNVADKTVAGTSKLGPGAVPVLLAISSALVALLVWMSFRASGEDRGAVLSGGAHPKRPVRRLLAVTAVSLTAMAGLATVVWSVVTPAPAPASFGQVIVVVAAATLMSVALTGAAFRIFGYAAGILVTLAVWMLQVFSFGGVWMLETIPAPLRALHPIAPMSYTRDGLIAAFNGSPGFVSAVATMAGITLLGLAAQYLAHRRHAARLGNQLDMSASPAEPAELVTVGADQR